MASRNVAAVIETKLGSVIVKERPISTPAADEILLRTRAVAGNPIEWIVRDYGFGVAQYPTVLGSDACGVIEIVGSSVTKFKAGDRVVAYAPVLYTSNVDHGAWQTYTVVKEYTTTAIPDKITFEQGCIFPMAFITSINAFFVQLGLPTPSNAHIPISAPGGNGFLIWGGGGAVAASMIQLGRALGFKVYTTASLKHADHLRKLGAAEVFNYKDKDVV